MFFGLRVKKLYFKSGFSILQLQNCTPRAIFTFFKYKNCTPGAVFSFLKYKKCTTNLVTREGFLGYLICTSRTFTYVLQLIYLYSKNMFCVLELFNLYSKSVSFLLQLVNLYFKNVFCVFSVPRSTWSRSEPCLKGKVYPG